MASTIGQSTIRKRAANFVLRRLSFSLRTLMLFVTVVTLWFGWMTHLAREQKAAVEELRAAGYQHFLYDFGWGNEWHPSMFTRPDGSILCRRYGSTPSSLGNLIGIDFVHRVTVVVVEDQSPESYAKLSRLPHLREVCVVRPGSFCIDCIPNQEERDAFDQRLEELKRTLPNVIITPVWGSSRVVG